MYVQRKCVIASISSCRAHLDPLVRMVLMEKLETMEKTVKWYSYIHVLQTFTKGKLKVLMGDSWIDLCTCTCLYSCFVKASV